VNIHTRKYASLA